MENRFDALAEQVFKKNLDDCHADEIRQLAEEFPYFTPAYLLLLRKLKTNSEEYRSVYQKAILYNSDPLSFERLINDNRFEQDEFVTTDKFKGKDDVPEMVSNRYTETFYENEEDNRKSEFNKEDASGSINSTDENEIIAYPLTSSLQNENIDVKEESNELKENELEVDVSSDESIGTNEGVDSEESNDVELKEIKWNLNLDSEPKGTLSFEPYHTVDYFASQGIKLSQEDNSQDKFGKQLKSFTEWLKTMKKLPESEVSVNLDRNVETKVEHLASGSLEDSEVVTEAMAEVWLRQGNRSKALEVYNKLSLQNPSKKAYFAAKIEQFNSHN